MVIPTYRRQTQLVDAVRSVMAQSFPDWAAAIVDDGGGLPELPESDRLAVVCLKRNTGVLGVVRNIGMAMAASEFVAFLDDDNSWLPDHLTAAVRALDADAGLAAVYTSIERRRPDGAVHDVYGQTFDRAVMKEQSLVDANGLVVRRSNAPRFSRLSRGRDTLPAEDWEFVWRLSRSGRVEHIDEVTVRYAINPASYYTNWDGLS